MGNKVTSVRGPYDLFSGDRNKPITVGYLAAPVSKKHPYTPSNGWVFSSLIWKYRCSKCHMTFLGISQISHHIYKTFIWQILWELYKNERSSTSACYIQLYSVLLTSDILYFMLRHRWSFGMQCNSFGCARIHWIWSPDFPRLSSSVGQCNTKCQLLVSLWDFPPHWADRL